MNYPQTLMPTTKDSFEQLGRRALGPRPARRVLALVLALTLLTRLPLFTIGLGIDEGGYSAVAAQWHPLHAGTSTYGNLFLDRPPLLLLLVKASLIFGNAGMRVLGMVCALSIVGGVWLAARRLLGPAGAIIAAPLAARICIDRRHRGDLYQRRAGCSTLRRLERRGRRRRAANDVAGCRRRAACEITAPLAAARRCARRLRVDVQTELR